MLKSLEWFARVEVDTIRRKHGEAESARDFLERHRDKYGLVNVLHETDIALAERLKAAACDATNLIESESSESEDQVHDIQIEWRNAAEREEELREEAEAKDSQIRALHRKAAEMEAELEALREAGRAAEMQAELEGLREEAGRAAEVQAELEALREEAGRAADMQAELESLGNEVEARNAELAALKGIMSSLNIGLLHNPVFVPSPLNLSTPEIPSTPPQNTNVPLRPGPSTPVSPSHAMVSTVLVLPPASPEVPVTDIHREPLETRAGLSMTLRPRAFNEFNARRVFLLVREHLENSHIMAIFKRSATSCAYTGYRGRDLRLSVDHVIEVQVSTSTKWNTFWS